jgi:flagellar hook-associated protein 2
VAQDIDTAVNKIKTFIGEFNTLVSKYNGLVTEKTYKDFPPLTEEQRGEMTEDEIKKWEEKAKSGILRSDLDLTSMLSNFRLAFSTKVEGTGMSLMDIGLSTISYSSDGQIEVNETALRKALADDPDTVANLFTQSSSATGSAKFSESGLMQRLSSVINSYVNDIQSASVEMTEKRISEIENKMEELENVLASNQERYYARFTAMEEALSKLNSTSNWLSSLFSSTASES